MTRNHLAILLIWIATPLLLASCATDTSLRPGYSSEDELAAREREAYELMRGYSDCVFENFRAQLENGSLESFPMAPSLAFAACRPEMDQFMDFLTSLSQDTRWIERQLLLFQQDVFNALRERFLQELERMDPNALAR